MNICARAGCRRSVPIKKTKPSSYCSTACRVADYRRRKRVRTMFREMGVDELVAQLRCIIDAQQQGQGKERDAALTTLASHPLLSGYRVAAEQKDSKIFLPSQGSARNRIGNTFSVPSAEESER